ncbi:MAG: hypothetical protein M1118_10335 [Chloroflexi bacterium]|nr:hypothetical protein [Chloroflexota bacterium]
MSSTSGERSVVEALEVNSRLLWSFIRIEELRRRVRSSESEAAILQRENEQLRLRLARFTAELTLLQAGQAVRTGDVVATTVESIPQAVSAMGHLSLATSPSDQSTVQSAVPVVEVTGSRTHWWANAWHSIIGHDPREREWVAKDETQHTETH